jgi:GNAT superfamily N-acetyltransferase
MAVTGIEPAKRSCLDVRVAKGADLAEARVRLKAEWGDLIVVRGESYAIDECACLVAGDYIGLAAFSLRDRPVAELVAINAFDRHVGIGTALLSGLVAKLPAEFVRLRLTTTNDNVDALRFYQRRGFRLVALRPGAVDQARATKPSIPLVGEYGIGLHDELDLVLELERAFRA